MLAQLDRRLKTRGEDVVLRRRVGTSNQSFVDCRIPAIVRALTVEQLIGSITQQNFFIIVSPTHIMQQQWPGGRTPPAGGSLIIPADPRIPTTSDVVMLRGSQRAIGRVAPIFDSGECIRIELAVTG